MITKGIYTAEELNEILKTKKTQDAKRKLDRYKISYETSGRGKNRTYILKEIENEFKVFCITDLGLSAKIDYDKFKYYIYNLLNDPDYKWLPDETVEQITEACEHKISRQTIAKHKKRLERANLITTQGANYVYYFAVNGKQKMTSRETYCKAWEEYFDNQKKGMQSEKAIYEMIKRYGGVARKQNIIEFNGIYMDKLETLNDLAMKAILGEIE